MKGQLFAASILATFTRAQDFESWPACNTLMACEQGTYLNQLACNCFAEAQCEIWCGEGRGIHPINGCSCVSNEEIRGFYPDWATQDDIDASYRLGAANYDPTNNTEPVQRADQDMSPVMTTNMTLEITPSQMWMKAGDLMKFASIDPFMGEITYLLVAIGMATHTGLDLFRYKSDSNYYDAYQAAAVATDTNWFKIGDAIKKWAYFIIYSIAAVTQILTGLGIATPINMLVWVWGVSLGAGVASWVAWLFKFLAHEQAYDNKKLGVQSMIRSSMIEDSIIGSSTALTKYMQMENWHWAVWEKLTQEEKKTQLEELMAEIEEWDTEKMAEMEAEIQEEKSQGDQDVSVSNENAPEVDAEKEDSTEKDKETEETV